MEAWVDEIEEEIRELGACMEAVAWTSNVRDVDQTEVLVVLKLLQWIKFKGICKIQVDGDNKTVIEAIQRQRSDSIRWEDQVLMYESSSLYKVLVEVEFRFVHRVCNNAADVLAKFARLNKCNSSWVRNPPEGVLKVIQQEVVLAEDSRPRPSSS
ncbi:hypothetical protein C5167_023184 [Papaver somniferum]|uniref:RNase H type-1 domain-containing protein n=1 Tax=Papaver somniferum TaxID=3469 RepID=A0A4Y7JK32_PAPSO|nr:uncharacterized protein LOC113277653 [Papaver somniferum]RZC61433.1 hypothetical protein C5167_023184 [Papaver somniferum]